jgi:tetratricopeptide (TPR) repeat protein
MRSIGLPVAILSGGLLLFCSVAFGYADQKGTLALQPLDSIGASNYLGRLQQLLLNSRWAEAEKLAEVLTKDLPRNPEPFYALGLARWRMNHPIKAIIALRSAEKLGLGTDSLHKLLGMAYYRVHQYGLFELEMNRAIGANPQDYEPYYFLALHYISDVGDLGTALKLLNEAIARKPDDMKSVYYRGWCEEMMNLRSDAQADYERAIALAKTSHQRFSLPYQGMADLLLRSNLAQAAQYAKQAVQLGPQLDSNHFILSKVEERQGKLSEAVAQLQQCARLNPTKASYHYMLFRLYLQMGKKEPAQSELKLFNTLVATYSDEQ